VSSARAPRRIVVDGRTWLLDVVRLRLGSTPPDGAPVKTWIEFLAFIADAEQRFLAEYPPHWPELPDEQLAALWALARPISDIRP
jgi:hypothetical protein